jgi:hypothetical protein
VGSFPRQLALDLQNRLELSRAVETGTYVGDTARLLARMFDDVVTIERSEHYLRKARERLDGIANVELVHGHSGEALTAVAHDARATLYWLDAHWSGGDTAGSDDPVPLMAELDAIGAGHPKDCVLIDDAREFATQPDPRWPSLVEVLDKLRTHRPDDHVTVIHDLVIAVPQEAKDIVDGFGRAHLWTVMRAGERARGIRPPNRLTERLHPLRAWVGRKVGR